MQRRKFLGVGTAAALGMTVAAPQAQAQGRRLGLADVERYHARLSDLRRLDDLVGGASTHGLVEAEVTRLSELAKTGSYAESTERALLSLMAEVNQFAAWTAFDCHLVEDAQAYALRAARVAHQAGSRILASTALSELSYVTTVFGDPKQGVSMAKASLANAPKNMIPAARVVLSDRLAWSQARSGNAAGVDQALGASSDAHDQMDSWDGHVPDMLYWINRSESSIQSGRCWAYLNDATRALPILETLDLPYDETHPREVAMYQCWSARAYLAAGDIDQSADRASKALDLTERTTSPRADRILSSLLKELQPHKEVQAVADLLERAGK